MTGPAPWLGDGPSASSGTAPLALELDRIPVDGLRLRVGHRGPAAGPARGTVVILPGRAEFIEKYEETIGELAALGFAVAIFDWRGQGGSDRLLGPHRGHIVQVEDYLADLAAVLEHLERRRLPRPFLMLAHSMGGHIGLRQLHDDPSRFAGAVLSAPMFGIFLPMPVLMARAICEAAIGLGAAHRYAPGQRDFDPKHLARQFGRLSSCEIRFQDLLRRLETTPELALGGVTYGWLGASLRSIALLRRPGFVEAITTPVLVCQAGRERIVSNRSIRMITRRLPNGRLLVLPEARHELLRERDPIRRQFLDAFGAFADEVTRACG
jgi:lysophospholipase